MSVGVVYAAFGHPYLAECQASVRTLREASPGISICVFCSPADAESPPLGLDEWFIGLLRGAVNPFASEEISSPMEEWQVGTCSKIAALMQSPFASTLFIDCDTVVLGDVRPIFELLPHFDVAAAYCTPWASAGQSTVSYLSISEAPLVFPEYNTGVILLNTASAAAQRFLRSWHQTTARLNAAGLLSSDQQAFREAAWLCAADMRMATLKQNWNCWGSCDHMPIVIAHKGLNKGDKALADGPRRLVEALRPSEAWSLLCQLSQGASGEASLGRPAGDTALLERLRNEEVRLLERRGWCNSPLGRAWAVIVFPWRVLGLCLALLGVVGPPALSADRDDVNLVSFVLKARQAWRHVGHDVRERGLRGLWKLLVDSHGDTPLLV